MIHSSFPRTSVLLPVLGSLLVHAGVATFFWSQRQPLQAQGEAAMRASSESDLLQLEATETPAGAPARLEELGALSDDQPQPAQPAPRLAPQSSPKKPAAIKLASRPARPERSLVAKNSEAKSADDWLSIDDQLPAQANSESASVAEPAEDELVQRIMRREREKALRRDQEAFPAQAEPNTASVSISQRSVSQRSSSVGSASVDNGGSSAGRAGAQRQGAADPEMALLHALPAAVALAPWSNPRVQPRQVLHLKMRFRDGALLALDGEPNAVTELDSLRRNAFELMRQERFEQREELKFDVVLTLSRVENTSLPALGFTPARLGSDGSAYVIFPSGLRVSMQLQPKAGN